MEEPQTEKPRNNTVIFDRPSSCEELVLVVRTDARGGRVHESLSGRARGGRPSTSSRYKSGIASLSVPSLWRRLLLLRRAPLLSLLLLLLRLPVGLIRRKSLLLLGSVLVCSRSSPLLLLRLLLLLLLRLRSYSVSPSTIVGIHRC